ncbi:disease resistance protein Roq1-like [Lycium ferocissimum]|uniref:disease resistance protein Roq1-like n=1 Tax=Lycium ferocissimum TaxID=112874 RepID=UPI00281522F4|nr:disease resistance protein Roq1-like [Lycium ferocissimum]XP_059297363.1 disease resistance protein Roq1-like [Lycium ferocissimum]XP_059297364.1 disease resistance protein Roq1-like [Lycium ferocissimum]XP_059297365.1 disease resistance protein Roq1-like [Lycium ferocissimum]
MGGIGKTEIASVLYQRYRHRFEADCFLGGVGTLYLKNGLTWLAEVVICKLLGKNMTLISEHEGVIIYKNMLRRKKVLFILDDINHRKELEFLVGGTKWFGRGSRIILIARDKHLLISHVGDNVYEVQLLPEDEPLELFSRHAFKEKSPKKDFMELSRQVVEYAGGLPLALKVLGYSFYKRDKEQWRDIIDRLKRIPHNDILGKLRLSFDGLDRGEKEIFLYFTFLYIACLSRNDIELYMELVLESRGFQLIGVVYLIKKSLLSIDINNRTVMHDMIREMGETIIREEYGNSRIWLPEEVRDLFKGKLITEKVESLCIPKEYDFEDDPVNYCNNFKRMKSLQVLIIGDRAFS